MPLPSTVSDATCRLNPGIFALDRDLRKVLNVPADAPAVAAPRVLWRGIPKPIPEFRFAPPRRWRFDYAWPEQKVALEVEGGVWTRGRHTRGKGFLADMEKYNRAVELGWSVIRTTPALTFSSKTTELLQALIWKESARRIVTQGA